MLEGTTLRAVYRHSSLSGALRLKRPLCAAINAPHSGPHAILVLQEDNQDVLIADPLSGQYEYLGRSQLKDWWVGDILYLSRKNSKGGI
jgi:hypothetical protein